MKIKPLSANVLVERTEADEVTPGGIVLPDSAKETPKIGHVRSVGPGKLMESGKRSSPQVKEGDKILFTSYAGTEFKHGSKKYLLMNENDILAILD